MNETSNASLELADVSLTLHLQVLGIVAQVYSAHDPKAPLRHWGSGMPQYTVRVGNDAYRAGYRKIGRIQGVVVLRRVDYYSGGQKVEEHFIPFSEAANLTLTFKGAKLS